MFILQEKNRLDGVTGEFIANAAKSFGHKNVIYVKDKNNIPDTLNEIKKRW